MGIYRLVLITITAVTRTVIVTSDLAAPWFQRTDNCPDEIEYKQHTKNHNDRFPEKILFPHRNQPPVGGSSRLFRSPFCFYCYYNTRGVPLVGQSNPTLS